MNDVWTSADLNALRLDIEAGRTIEQAAARLRRPVREVREMARDLGWIESPPLAPLMKREGIEA
jgi:hypothetical protein